MTPPQQVTIVTADLEITLGTALKSKTRYGGKIELDFGSGSGPGAGYEVSSRNLHWPRPTHRKHSASRYAKLFAVRPNEVALLRLEKGLLKFVFPDQLKTAGSIPVSSSSSVAAHTASTKKTELFNTFAKVKHARVFETVRLGTTEETDQSEQTSIQKLMSAPILNPQKKVLGVIQICRKGFELATSGPDFTIRQPAATGSCRSSRSQFTVSPGRLQSK